LFLILKNKKQTRNKQEKPKKHEEENFKEVSFIIALYLLIIRISRRKWM